MPFTNSLPEWNKTATAPTQTKKDAGWSQEEKPPASLFNWFFNTTYKALQELQQEAVNVDQKGVANGVASLDSNGDVPIGQADNILNWVKGFGLGDVALNMSSTDLNTLDLTGFYRGNNFTNSPVNGGYFFITNIKWSSADRLQKAVNLDNGDEYTRKQQSNTWSAWVKTATLDATGKVAMSNLPAGTNNGLATLDATGKVPASQLNISSTGTAISITDSGNYYTGTNVETALQEVGQTLNAMRGSLITSTNSLLGL